MQNLKPLAYACRSLSPSERNYAQIEKELLAIVYGLQKFHYYVYGRDVTIYTDHKPLVSIVYKPLSKASKRIQSMLLKIQDCAFKLVYKQGTTIPVADALSRAPVEKYQEINLMSNASGTSIKIERFEEIRQSTEKDPTCCTLKKVIAEGWPHDKHSLPIELTPYWTYRDELTIENGIIYRGERIVIPQTLRPDMKKKIHAGHAGINSCLRRARTLVFWPRMSSEIRQYCEACITCASV